MKQGDKVTVTDGSYSLTIGDNKLEHTSGTTLMARGVHTIVAVDCVLPGYCHSITKEYTERNNTIIQGADIVTFIQERFLAPYPAPKKYCSECGKAR